MTKLRLFILSLLLLAVLPAQAEIAVVVHRDSGVTALSRSEVVNIYMGRYRRLPNGATAIPIDLVPLKGGFYRSLVNQDLAQINSYWARLVFSGQAGPPQQVESVEELLRLLRDNRSAVAFLSSSEVPDELQVVHTVSEPGRR